MFFDKKEDPYSNENLVKLCKKCCEHMINQIENVIPATGKIKGTQVHFKNIIKGWHIQDCGLRITQHYKTDNMRSLEIYATFPDGSGYEMKNFISSGTNDELCTFLKREELTKEMIDILSHFSEAIYDKI